MPNRFVNEFTLFGNRFNAADTWAGFPPSCRRRPKCQRNIGPGSGAAAAGKPRGFQWRARPIVREMKPRQVTLKDVARAANVALSTASEALSGRGRIAAETRKAVEKAARELGYEPNTAARSLRTGRARAIGIHHLHAGDRFASHYFRSFVTGVMEVAQEADYDLTLLASDPQAPRSHVARVDGIIIADPILTDLRAHEILRSSTPVIAGELYPPGMPSSPVVAADHAEALVEILNRCRGGFSAPVLIGPDDQSGWGHLLRSVFGDWCRQANLTPRFRTTAFGDGANSNHRQLLHELFEALPQSDLLVISSAAMAIEATRVLPQLGLRPGLDVLIACCADEPSLQSVEPAVTAIDIHPELLGRKCAQVLLDWIEGSPEKSPADQLIPAEVKFRGSTPGTIPVDSRGPSGKPDSFN